MPQVGRPSTRKAEQRIIQQLSGGGGGGGTPVPVAGTAGCIEVSDPPYNVVYGDFSQDYTSAVQGALDAAAPQFLGDVGKTVCVRGVVHAAGLEVDTLVKLQGDYPHAWFVKPIGKDTFGISSRGYDTGTPAYAAQINGIIYDGNYIKFNDGYDGIENPDAEPWGGPGGDGFRYYGEGLHMDQCHAKNCKGRGMDLLSSQPFGAGALAAGYQFIVTRVTAVNCYGTDTFRWGGVDGILSNFYVINWDEAESHLVTPGLPYSEDAIGNFGLTIAGGGSKISNGHVWGIGHWRSIYAYGASTVASTITAEGARDACLWVYGSDNEWRNMDIYQLTTTLQPFSKGLVLGSDGTDFPGGEIFDCWGLTFSGHFRNFTNTAIHWQRGTLGNEVTGSIVQPYGTPELVGDPASGQANYVRLRVREV